MTSDVWWPYTIVNKLHSKQLPDGESFNIKPSVATDHSCLLCVVNVDVYNPYDLINTMLII